nr:hypothetical protein Itr_chr02CG00770 [Ipomoea trifida]
MPTMLLFLVRFVGLWELTEHPNIVEVYEFPSIQVCSNRDIHVFHSSPFQPPTRLFQGRDSPHPRCPIKPEEVEEISIYLLLHLEMEAHVDVLKAGEQILVLVHEDPPCLNKSHFWVISILLHLWLELLELNPETAQTEGEAVQGLYEEQDSAELGEGDNGGSNIVSSERQPRHVSPLPDILNLPGSRHEAQIPLIIKRNHLQNQSHYRNRKKGSDKPVHLPSVLGIFIPDIIRNPFLNSRKCRPNTLCQPGKPRHSSEKKNPRHCFRICSFFLIPDGLRIRIHHFNSRNAL